MSYQSDGRLIVTDVNLFDFAMNPTLSLDDFTKGDDTWNYKIEFYKDDGLETDEEHDTIRIEVGVTFTTVKNKKKIAMEVHTEYYMKIMDRDEISEELWKYIVNTAVWHCAALFLYKTDGKVPVDLKIPELVALQTNLIRTKFLELWKKN